MDTVRRAFAAIGFQPTGVATVSFEGEETLARALERWSPGSGLAEGEGGAMRWRVLFAGGGEGAATVAGGIWLVRRPVPAETGANLFPAVVEGAVRRGLVEAFPDLEDWQWAGSQSWREGDVTWHRAHFVRRDVALPPGWESHLEVDLAGSTIISFQRRTEPFAADVGVVMGRVAELELLRSVGILGLAAGLIGVLLAGAEQMAFRRAVAPWAGFAVGALAWVAGTAAAVPRWECTLGAISAGAVVGLLPANGTTRRGGHVLAVPAGVAAALFLMVLPGWVAALGGWLPMRAPLPADTSFLVLAGKAWFVALAEEPLLRGAIPMLLAPLTGWWGGACVAALLGSLLHPTPAVPLVATLAAELCLNLGMMVVARLGGIRAAVLARGVCEGLVRRPAFPAGWETDALVLAATAVAMAVSVAGPGRRAR